MNCTYYTTLDPPERYPYRYKCFKSDWLFGAITIGFSFTPGILLSYLMAKRLYCNPTKKYSILVIMSTPVIMLTFPFLLISVKVITNNLSYIRTAWGLLEGCLRANWGLPEGCLRAAWGLPEGCMRAAWGLPEDCSRQLEFFIFWELAKSL